MRDTSRFAQAVEITTATYDQVAGDYARHHEEMRPHWAERLEEFVDLLGEEVDRHPIPNGGVPEGDVTLAEFLQFLPVLDAGCGPGRDARALAAHDLPVLGIDLSCGDARGGRRSHRAPIAAWGNPLCSPGPAQPGIAGCQLPGNLVLGFIAAHPSPHSASCRGRTGTRSSAWSAGGDLPEAPRRSGFRTISRLRARWSCRRETVLLLLFQRRGQRSDSVGRLCRDRGDRCSRRSSIGAGLDIAGRPQAIARSSGREWIARDTSAILEYIGAQRASRKEPLWML